MRKIYISDINLRIYNEQLVNFQKYRKKYPEKILFSLSDTYGNYCEAIESEEYSEIYK